MGGLINLVEDPRGFPRSKPLSKESLNKNRARTFRFSFSACYFYQLGRREHAAQFPAWGNMEIDDDFNQNWIRTEINLH